MFRDTTDTCSFAASTTTSIIRFPADRFGAELRVPARPVGWARPVVGGGHGGGGDAPERRGAGGTVPRRLGRPVGPAPPGDLAAGEGPPDGRGGRDDRVRGAVGREAAGALQRRGSGGPGRPTAAQREGPDGADAGAARRVAAALGGDPPGRGAGAQPQGRGLDGGGARAGLRRGPARLGGAAGGRVVGPGAAAGTPGPGDAGGAGGVQRKLAAVAAEEAAKHPGKAVEVF